TDRIGNIREYDGNAARLLQHRCRGGGVLRKNEIGLLHDEFLRESLHGPHVDRRPTSFDVYVPTLRPSELLKSFPECSDKGWSFPFVLGIRHQHANPPHPLRLLRARRERPRCGRATEKRYELAPLHVSRATAMTQHVRLACRALRVSWRDRPG